MCGINLTETLLTQWRSSVGVEKPSPLKTCPKCPPQAAHVISVLLPSGSGWKYNATAHTKSPKVLNKINICYLLLYHKLAFTIRKWLIALYQTSTLLFNLSERK